MHVGGIEFMPTIIVSETLGGILIATEGRIIGHLVSIGGRCHDWALILKSNFQWQESGFYDRGRAFSMLMLKVSEEYPDHEIVFRKDLSQDPPLKMMTEENP